MHAIVSPRRVSTERVVLDVGARDEKLIEQIAERAVRLLRDTRWGPRATRVDWQMDVTACHANGNPLDLAALLAASNLRFARDLVGIAQNIDRGTGELMNDFAPLHAQRSTARAA